MGKQVGFWDTAYWSWGSAYRKRRKWFLFEEKPALKLPRKPKVNEGKNESTYKGGQVLSQEEKFGKPAEEKSSRQGRPAGTPQVQAQCGGESSDGIQKAVVVRAPQRSL